MNTPLLAFVLGFNLGPVEIVVILLVALLVFGRRLPEVARSLGQGLVEFRKGLRDEPTDHGPQALPTREEPVANGEDPTSESTCEDAAVTTEGVEDEDPERPPTGDVNPAG